ncbi:MTOR-associated protein MEAK7 isoform X2 [Leptinotarsa decemlineata]|uniref:MTOR-associated protein MEAK7 isoform X2 n=1 Tax=Leptinotarsa decemlineata TaxID=7539 RepID=UPI003D30C6E4
MGVNSSKKLAAKCSFLSKDEQLIVSNSFKLASKNSERIKEEELAKIWGSQMDARLLQYLNNYLFGIGDQRQNTVDLERFAELFVFCTRGTVDEKMKVLLMSLGKPESEGSDIPYTLVKEYVESIVASYMKIQKLCNTKQYKSWFSRGCFTLPQNIQRLAENLIHELATGETITRRCLEVWLQGSTLLGQLLLFVSMYLFSISHKEKSGVTSSEKSGRIVNQGPSVLIVEDKNGYMFGGFAPANWELSPKFYGDDSSFLFTLAPRMRVFPSTGYNQHFQYLNLHQQTLPNGLAMGGQHGYWGLWIDSEYGKGETSQSCTTYTGYQQMSLSKEFTFRHLEVWGLGQPPPTPQEKGERVGILDGNVESKAILKMAGKTMYSEFVKEPPPV